MCDYPDPSYTELHVDAKVTQYQLSLASNRSQHSGTISGALATSLLLILIVLYALLAGRSIWLPGIYYDEVLQAVSAIAALRGNVNGPLTRVEGSVVNLAGHSFPLMTLPYLGSVQTGILTLVFAVTNTSIPVMRSTFITLGAAALVLTFLFTCYLFDTRTALLSTLLLATDPTYIFSMRSDNGPTAIMMICKMGALWLLLRWWQTEKPAHLLLGAFLCGVGLYDKLNFIWFLGALVASTIIIYPRQVQYCLQRSRWPTRFGAVICFCVGTSILLAYTILTGGGPFRGLLKLASQETPFGIATTDFWGNLNVRLASLFRLLSGYELLNFYTSTFSGYHYPYSRGLFLSTALPWLGGLAILAGITQTTLQSKNGIALRKAVFLLMMSALIVVASTFTPTNLMYHHLLVVYPFLHLLSAHFVTSIPNFIDAWKLREQNSNVIGHSISVTAVVIALITNLGVLDNYYQVLEKTGGVGMWSDAIYELADYLEGDDRTVICMDWGINLNLLALSQGDLHTLEPWQEFLYTCAYSPKMENLISHPNQIYIFHAPKYAGVLAITEEDCPRVSFFKTVEATGATTTLEKRIFQRNGDPLFNLYTVSNPRE